MSILSEILPLDTDAEKLRAYKAIIISGGPKSVHDEDAPKYDPNVLNLGIPVLGECFSFARSFYSDASAYVTHTHILFIFCDVCMSCPLALELSSIFSQRLFFFHF